MKFYTEKNGKQFDVTKDFEGMILKKGLSIDFLITNSTQISEKGEYLIDQKKIQQAMNELRKAGRLEQLKRNDSSAIVANKTQIEKETTIEIVEEEINSTKSQIAETSDFEISKEENSITELKMKKPIEFASIQSKKNIQHEVIRNLQFISSHTKKDWVEKKVDLYDPITQSMTRFYFAVEKEKEKTFDQLLQVTKLTDSIQTLVRRNIAILIGSTNVKLSKVEKEKNSFIKNLNIYFGTIKKSILKRFDLQQKECFCEEENCFILDRNVKFEETITIHRLKRAMNYKEQYGLLNRRKFYNKVQNNVLDTIMDIQSQERTLTKKRYVA